MVAVERFVDPVLRDLGELAVLDGNPVGGAGRVVRDGRGKTAGVGQLSLQFGLPGSLSGAVAAVGIGQNQQLAQAAVLENDLMLPPGSGRTGGRPAALLMVQR